MVDPGGLGGAVPPPPFLGVLFLDISEVYKQKLVLNKYEIYLKMLEMVIFETQIFKNLKESHLWHPLVPSPF